MKIHHLFILNHDVHVSLFTTSYDYQLNHIHENLSQVIILFQFPELFNPLTMLLSEPNPYIKYRPKLS